MFNNDQNEQGQLSFLDQLVGDGKKFSDVEALAKGKVEADKYIEELKAKVGEQDYAKQLLETLKQKPDEGSTEPEEKEPVTPATLDDLKSAIKAELESERQAAKADSNLTKVKDVLNQKYGVEAQTKYLERGKELGLSETQMESMAKATPEAFLALFGETMKAQTTNPQVSTTQNTLALPNTQGTKNNAYYRKMKKDDPRRFYSPAIQSEMVKMAEEQGANFYK